MDVIGRKYEQRELQRCYNSKEAEFVVVYGRRRIGKTFLVNQFFNQKFDFKLTGIYDKELNVQLDNFSDSLKEYSGKNDWKTPTNWREAFMQLKQHITDIHHKGKKVVFIDEMPWLDTRNSDFFSSFEWFWNNWGSTQNDLLLIVCGSATSWITNKLLSDKGGLFNRTTNRIYLRQFSLAETEEYLRSQGVKWSRYDITECYMTMGGIPFYLKQINPKLSYNANIDTMFFSKRGKLWDEFSHLFKTLFSTPENYIAVVEALAQKRMGLTREEILKATKLPDNGNTTEILNNLINSDFVRPYNYFGKRKKGMVFQLSDYYTLFYFRFIKEHYGRDEEFWSHTIDNPSRTAWAGYSFEQVCKDHLSQIKKAIGISAVLCETSCWYSTDGDAPGIGNVQIDFLIDRRDHVINLCEMKFSISEFAITKEYEVNLRNKIAALQAYIKNKKAINLTMVTTYGVKENLHSGIVQSEVTLDDLFAAIV